MGNLLSSPSTDAGYRREKEDTRDASSSVSELPSFPRISDDKDNDGRRSPVTCLYNGAQPSGPESAQNDETDPTKTYMPNVLTTPTNVSSSMKKSPMLATGPSAPPIPTAHPTTLESTPDDIMKQPTSQVNDPDVTPSLFSPTIVFETPEPTIIQETPTIYETPMDRTPAPTSAQSSADHRQSERKSREDTPPNRQFRNYPYLKETKTRTKMNNRWTSSAVSVLRTDLVLKTDAK